MVGQAFLATGRGRIRQESAQVFPSKPPWEGPGWGGEVGGDRAGGGASGQRAAVPAGPRLPGGLGPRAAETTTSHFWLLGLSFFGDATDASSCV